MKPTNSIVALFVLVTISAQLFGCQRSEQQGGTPALSGSTVQIISISPGIGEALRAGEKVKLKVDINYALSEESGTLALVVQAADNSAIAQNFEVVTKGSGKVALEAEFIVPNTKAIQIFTPLSGQGQNSTSTVDTRAFKVVSN
jgi:hypothetical protein